MNNFRELKVWHKSIDLLVDVYHALSELPDSEKFNLISQMQRSAVSIPSNIAEGCGRHSAAAFKQFLSVAMGSSYELETQLIISNKLEFLKEESFNKIQPKIVEIQKMTYGLMNTLS
jgi:four helix bundle protein